MMMMTMMMMMMLLLLQENDAFFVMTNVVVTPGQTQDRCPEVRGYTATVCNSVSMSKPCVSFSLVCSE